MIRFEGQGYKQLGMQADRTKQPAERRVDSGVVVDHIDISVVCRKVSGGTSIAEKDVARIEA